MQSAQFGPYTIREPLGEGGFSQVYRAHDRRRHETVALKLLDPAVTATEEGRQRFLREVEAARRLHYRHIVPVYEAGIIEGRAFLAMRLMRGGTLAKQLERAPILDGLTAAQVIRHTARALDHAQRLGIIHRDVKPSNIFYYDDGHRLICLGDFGLAKVRGLATVTQMGQVIGSVYYMSPEQVRGLAYTTERSDVYSLGVVLYEMLAGRVPFKGHSQADVLHAIVHADPPRPRQFNGQITAEMERVILRALSKQPERRYASARELAAGCQSAFPGRPKQFATPQRARQSLPDQAKRLAAAGQRGRPGNGRQATQRPEFWIAVLGVLAIILFILYLAG